MGVSDQKKMPEKIVLQDGTEREIPTAEELKSQNEQADKAKVVDGIRKELGLADDADLTSAIKEAKESSNPNWAAARQKMKILQDAAKAKGVEIDDAGNILDKPVGIKAEDVSKMVSEKTTEALFIAERDRALSKHSVEDKKVVEHYFNKLMTGEDKSVANILKFTKEAESLAFPDRRIDPIKNAFNSSGAGPRYGAQAGQVNKSAVEMGAAFGNSEEDLKKGGSVADLILKK